MDISAYSASLSDNEFAERTLKKLSWITFLSKTIKINIIAR